MRQIHKKLIRILTVIFNTYPLTALFAQVISTGSDKGNMKYFKLLFIITFALTFSSCSREINLSRISPGDTKISEAIELLKKPVFKSDKLYVWKDISLQIDSNEVVRSIHRSPASHEKSVDFWESQYREIKKESRKVTNAGVNLWELTIPSKGINIIFDKKSHEVSKIIFSEPSQK